MHVHLDSRLRRQRTEHPYARAARRHRHDRHHVALDSRSFRRSSRLVGRRVPDRQPRAHLVLVRSQEQHVHRAARHAHALATRRTRSHAHGARCHPRGNRRRARNLDRFSIAPGSSRRLARMDVDLRPRSATHARVDGAAHRCGGFAAPRVPATRLQSTAIRRPRPSLSVVLPLV